MKLKQFLGTLCAMCMLISAPCFAASRAELEPIQPASRGIPVSPSGAVGNIECLSPTNIRKPSIQPSAVGAIDDVEVIKGSCQFNQTDVGAYYYAYSGMSSSYSEAFANIKLPSSLNTAGNTRHAFISLGIVGSGFSIDMGIMNTGTGWYPVYYEVNAGGEAYPNYTAATSATNAIITVKPASPTTVEFYVRFVDSKGNTVGDIFWTPITIQSGSFNGSAGSFSCRFYRFASLVPNKNASGDNQNDGSHMKGGQFTNLGLYNVSSKVYDAWGINTSRVTDAWKCSPERISLTYTTNRDTFNIIHSS